MLYRVKSIILHFLSDIRLYPLGIVLYGQTGYKVKGHHTRKIIGTVAPGDVLLTRYDHYLGYFFIRGFWGHAGIYVGGDRVIHMLGDGIQKEDILTFCRKDHVAVLRCDDLQRARRAARIACDLYDERVDYDYDFKLGNKTFYCSELIWHCYGEDPLIKYKTWVLPADLVCPLFEEIYRAP